MGQRKNQSKHRRRRATKHRSRKHRGGSYLGTAAAYIFNERHMVDAKTFSEKVVELIKSDDTYNALRNYTTDIQHAVECYIMSKQFSIT